MEERRTPNNTSEARRALSLARTLLTKGGALESTDSGEAIDRTRLAEALERRIEVNLASGSPPPSLTAKAAATEALTNAESALNKTAGGASPSNLTDLEITGLEAIIEVLGRPAMSYSNGQVQMPPSDLGENDRWRVLIATARSKINRASAAVGRITITGNTGITEHIGTGWRAGDDLLVTNRHVVRTLVENPDASPPTWTIDVAKRPVIDFTATYNTSTTQRVEIADLVFCAEETYVDLAFLRLATDTAALPASLPVDWNPEAVGSELAMADGESPVFRGNEVYLVGHPYRQQPSELIMAVIGAIDGSKRWSPGLITRMDPELPMIEHDCSTLGGNSGSCVLTTVSHAVVGIHIGGLNVDDLTGRGSANLALAFSRLDAHRAIDILRMGRI
jgi:trypsin-like peptidase